MKENKKNKKILYLICTIVGILLIVCSSFFFFNKSEEKAKEEIIPRLEDDFYEAINYETLKNAKIASDKSSWSKADDASDAIDKRIEEIVEEILSDPNYKNEKIDNYLELYNDFEEREKLGLSEIKPYLEMIDNASTIDELNDVLLKIARDFKFITLFNFGYDVDLYDSSKNVFIFETMTINDINFECYTEKKYERIIKLIDKIVLKECESIGYSNEKAKEEYNKIVEFAKTIQEKSKYKLTEITDLLELYHKYTLDDILKEIKNLPIKKLLDSLNVSNEDFYIVYDIDHLKAIDEYYTIDNINIFKEITKLHLIDKVFNFSTTKNEEYMYEIMNELYGTKKSIEEYRKDVTLAIKQLLITDEIERRYEEKYFTDEDKKIVADLVDEVREYYKNVINNSEWLSNETKEEALKKLNMMKVNIGRKEKDENKDDEIDVISKSEGGTLISNEIHNNQIEWDKFSEDFHKPPKTIQISTLAVNAYYLQFDNSINFLAGFKEMYGNETDYYKLLGYFGTVIGHEISHAFDSNGSKHDENGVLRDWWTEEDKEQYNKLTKAIEDYYSKYEYMGFNVDGKKTLSENIADLAAMKAMISIAENKGATKDDFKKMFEAYTDLWAKKENKQSAELQTFDEHSPNKVRVNAVLSSMDKFYEVYDIKEGDKMYVPKKERVGLW